MAVAEADLSPRIFFEKWFRTRGTCCFFLFKKNLKVTNIQLAELLALMRSHFSAEGEDAPTELQFITSSDFKDSLRRMFDDFGRGQDAYESHCVRFADVYAPLFRRLVVADAFFGSCAVFVPPLLSLDLASICALSGYIHSCGYNVFTRKAYKTNKAEFHSALEKYLNRTPTPGKRVFFAAYSHEDFTDYDRRWKDEQLDGLDNVKIFVEKYYMGSDSLVSVLREMGDKFHESIVIPEAGNFREKHRELNNNSGIDHSRTLWLLVDRSTTDQRGQAGETKYFICYAQLYKNDNPFHRFDENKPAWLSHTTIPHTLMGAMINITRPWPQKTPISIADPFLGSGTTWLEMLKYPQATCNCGDLETMVQLLTQDNLDFFSATADQLQEYIEALQFVLAPSTAELLESPSSAGGKGATHLKAYSWAIENHFRIFETRNGNKSAAKKALRLISHAPLRNRLFLYVALRTTVRHHLAFERVPEARRRGEWTIAYRNESQKLLDEFIALQELRNAADKEPAANEAIIGFAGKYSTCQTINTAWLRKNISNVDLKRQIKCVDAKKLKKGHYDIIVTDPPYGFNEAGEDQRKLASFYASIMEILVLALKKDGQLVFAVPDWSHTGKHLPYFTYRQVITQQVLVAAERNRREVFSSALAVPGPGSLFRPPYFWESDRALRRAILHFRIRALDHAVKTKAKATDKN
jgi:hypothetical protein